MKPTVTNENRFCLNCSSGPLTGNAKQKFCSTNCRIASFRKNQSLTILEQDYELERNKTLIHELKEAPIKRTESVRVVNPIWQLARQAYDSQQTRCAKTEQKLNSCNAEIHSLTEGKTGSWIGAGTGLAFVFIVMSLHYDNRQEKPLGTAFPVISLICLVGIALIGYEIGKRIQRIFLSSDARAGKRLNELIVGHSRLTTLFLAESDDLEKLGKGLALLPRYASQTITSTDEVRSTSSILPV